MHTPPRTILVLMLLSSIVLLLSAAVGTFAGIRGQEYFFVGFELVLVVSAMLGVLTGLGKFNQGPSISIACVAGATATCSLLGYITLGGEVLVSGSLFGAHGDVLGVDVFLPFVGRMFIAGLLTVLAGLILLLREPKVSVPLLVRGVLCGIPVVLGLGAWIAMPALRQTILSWHPLMLVFLGSVGVLVVIGLVAASGHCLIRAFEVGVQAAQKREDEESSAAAPSVPTSRDNSPKGGEGN